MSNSTRSIDSTRPTVTIEPARERQTKPPVTPFRDVLAGSVGVLLTGAEVATGVVGGPVLAAAVHEAKANVVTGIAGQATFSGPNGVANAVAASAGGNDIATAHAMQRESQAFNIQLMQLQQDVQDENRRFSTLTNVLRAKHDTAKAAVGNIRS